MSSDISAIAAQVQHNCHVSDANFGSTFSLCGFLLRLRELYKWESGLSPWEEPEPATLLKWIEDRESFWEPLFDQEFRPITWNGTAFDPFDAEGINRTLRPRGYVYGAGYVTGMKPSFFLGELVSSKTIGELRVDVVGKELARDLFTSPAMRLENQIFARRQPMTAFLWGHLFEMKHSALNALQFAVGQYGVSLEELRRSPRDRASSIVAMAHAELDIWIHHELGEVFQEGFEVDTWREIVGSHAGTPVEIYARAIKDILADTHRHGLLGHIARHRLAASLAFYVAFLPPFSKILFPEILRAFKVFRTSGDWESIEDVRKKAYERTRSLAASLVTLHGQQAAKGSDWVRERILAELIEPLGVLKKSVPGGTGGWEVPSSSQGPAESGTSAGRP
ncbi:Sfum_1244 family protein [Desulfoglaeba alkanexedens]|uniref:Uncharacterized protein n=1 Tax=Desulfoglaeba alkanexedens ALDC TaxID=980445 RepID=A0A4P8L048_9BACT|nr:Sfum_1244 family protein [Desulfoglaeba alkanexedens]QCQ21089.1 hypothetical protein FDQ92_02055 [Desulfoglaeba alkanexedens ALDC]